MLLALNVLLINGGFNIVRFVE